MGKARSYEVIEYRKKIQKALCTDPEILKLLGESDTKYPEDTIPFHKVYPHEYIPETVTDTRRLINFDIRADLNNRNKTLKNLTIWFWVVCHQDVVPYFEDGRPFCWYDCAVCALDNLFTDTNPFGIGNLELISNVPYCPEKVFKGRQLTFTIFDFYNGARYGK